MLIRPLRHDDVEECERISDEAFYQADAEQTRAGDAPPQHRTPSHSARWIERTRHILATDPGGCWAAESDGRLLGFATSLRRETLWCLATFAVRPELHGRGIGRQLMDAALTHSIGCLRGMLSASSDPGALRRYHRAGFELHPQVRFAGVVDRAAIPSDLRRVRDGTPGDRELLDSIDRRLRGAGHGVDHDVLAREGRLLVLDTTSGSGYVYASTTGVLTLGATRRRTASTLLWTVLAESRDAYSVTHVSGANQWAISVCLEARLQVIPAGYLALRGMKPPVPYVHHGSLM